MRQNKNQKYNDRMEKLELILKKLGLPANSANIKYAKELLQLKSTY